MASKGYVLLVVSLDRVSPDKILEQVGLFTTLIKASITVVSLINRQVLNKEASNNDPLLLMLSILCIWRTHDESQHKSRRLREAWRPSASVPEWRSSAPDAIGFLLLLTSGPACPA